MHCKELGAHTGSEHGTAAAPTAPLAVPVRHQEQVMLPERAGMLSLLLWPFCVPLGPNICRGRLVTAPQPTQI